MGRKWLQQFPYNKFKWYMKSSAIKAAETANKPSNLEAGKPNTKAASKEKESLNDQESMKILEEVERLLDSNENLQAINLLRALKDNMQAVKNQSLVIVTIVNLGVLYYQVGFLEEANQEFALAISKLKELSQKLSATRSKDVLRGKYETMIGRLQLQVCILFSELGKHDIALQHARTSSKVSFNLIYDVLCRLYSNVNKTLLAKSLPKKDGAIELPQAKEMINCIAALNHLLSGTKDLKLAFLQKERASLLEEQNQATRKFGTLPSQVDIEMLYSSQQRLESAWVFKNKILDEIQLIPLQIDYFEDASPEVSKNEVIEKIAFLAISLYCYSTETRFIEKLKNCDSHDVLDSQHWLSRSLEIAYSFMPPQAPILNQILTVHDRFHGLDKQTIPEDEEVTGFFKVLRPLSKPKSVYTSKTPGCSPIMIRIQAEKAEVPVDAGAKTQRELPISRNILELDQSQKTIDLNSLPKGHKVRNLSHGHRRIETTDIQTERTSNISRATIESPLTINGSIRNNYPSKKLGKIRENRLKVNLSDLHGKALISEDLLNRPQSLQQVEAKQEAFRSTTQHRKKSLPFRKTEGKRPHTLGNTGKYSGLQLKGQKMEQALQADLFQKLHNETKMLQSARIGGNVYINNNINLYISKNSEGNPFGQTFIRGQVLHQKPRQDKQKELSRRQMFLNKRRANNFFGEELQ